MDAQSKYLNELQNVYFIGIGGIGMSALARYFKAMGKQVAGYDKTSTKLTDELVREGIEVHFDDDVNNISEKFKNQSSVLVVYTPAVPKEHVELNYFKANNFIIKKRAEVLGVITAAAYTVAVAGTHGKTTTSSLVAHVLKTAGLNPSAFLGGITQNYNTNLLLSDNLDQDKQPLVVVEADEYDRSFLTLLPEIAIITSVDADHLDIYGDKKYVEESYSLFAQLVKSKLVLKKNIVDKVNPKTSYVTYSLNDSEADFYAQNIKIENGVYNYEIVTPSGILKSISLGLPGLHNIENSIAAVAVAILMGVDESAIRVALTTFRGVRRRFDYQIKTDELIFIDDYAHHPEELKACIGSVKAMYPGKKVTGIFQPHLYSRTRDFADDFAKSLDMLDECVLLDIYPARELPIEGVSSEMLLNKMKLTNKQVCKKNDLVNELSKRKIEVLITMGAGDIDRMVEPIKEGLLKKKIKI